MKEATNNELNIMLENMEKNLTKEIREIHVHQDRLRKDIDMNTYHRIETQKFFLDVAKNTEFRTQAKTMIALIKWLGFGQVATIVYLFAQFLMR